jgi:hypothetical protein
MRKIFLNTSNFQNLPRLIQELGVVNQRDDVADDVSADISV